MTLNDLIIVGIMLFPGILFLVYYGIESGVEQHSSEKRRRLEAERLTRADERRATIAFWEQVALTSESPVEVNAALRYLEDFCGVIVPVHENRAPGASLYRRDCRCATCHATEATRVGGLK